MLYGDGHICPRDYAARNGKWRIDFSEGDAEVLEAYAFLTKKVFNVTPGTRKRGNWSEIYYCSRIVYEYYTTLGGHPTGKKTGKLSIPNVARDCDAVLRGFICGLFSVEGSVKDKRYVRLTIEMLEPRLLAELRRYLFSLNLRPHTYKYEKRGKTMHGLYLYGPEDTAHFLKKFGLIGAKRSRLVRFLTSVKPTPW